MTSQFLTESPPATNPNSGKSVTIATKTPPEMLQAILQITEGTSSPYTNVSAFVRAAIHRLVLEIGQETEGTLLPPIIVLLKEWSRQHFKLTTHEQIVTGMKNNARLLEVYLEHGGTKKAVETLEEISGDILNLSDPFWRRVCLEELWKFSIAKEVLKLGEEPKAIMAYEMWKEGQE